jgi:hypothetical protein
MFKEFVLAIILGALLGFGLTGGYFALKTNKKNEIYSTPTPIPVIISPIPENKTSPQPTEKPISTNPNSLIIDKPENESIINNSKTTVSGKSSPKSTIIITTSQKTYNQNTQEDGLFAIDIELESGANKINVSSIDKEDNQIDTQLIVTYSTAKI